MAPLAAREARIPGQLGRPRLELSGGVERQLDCMEPQEPPGQRELRRAERGIFTLPHTKLYLSLAHTDADVDWTLDAMEESLRTVS